MSFQKSLIASLLFFFASLSQASPLVNGTAVFDNGSIIVPITGDINVPAKQMTVDPWPFFGSNVETKSVELLDPGTYSRTGGDFTVPPGHLGAHMLVNWSFNDIYVVMVWDVNFNGTLDEYRIIDSDGDGLPGHALTNGPFVGLTVYYEFDADTSGPPQPGVSLFLSVEGGNVQECTGNLSDDVTINAMATVFGGAVLDSIIWTVDGANAGTGDSITENLALGVHTIEATALTTTGESDTESVEVTVEDTTRPVVVVDFISNNGNGTPIDVKNEIATPGSYGISIQASDSCDPQPQITYSDASTTSEVMHGDTIRVNNSIDNLQLPVTGVRLEATAKDSSGNFNFVTDESVKVLRFR